MEEMKLPEIKVVLNCNSHFISLCRLDEFLLDDNINLFAPQTIMRINDLKSERRKKEILAVNYLINSYTNINTFIDYKECKPFVVEIPEKQISISHSSKYAGVFMSDSYCGFDIEEISSRITRISHKFTSSNEILLFTEKYSELEALYHIWTAKEAVYKITGMPDFIKDIKIKKFVPNKNMAEINAIYKEKDIIFKVYFKIIDNHVLAWTILA